MAALPDASTIEPSALSAIAPSYCRPPGALSPACTSYLNSSTASSPVPCTYDALCGSVVARASTGLPVTVTSSSKVTAMLIVWPMPYVPLGRVVLTACTRGETVSTMMLSPAKSPGAGRVRFAALPTASAIEPPFALSASVPAWRRPPGELSPGSTSYLNRRTASSPVPSCTYDAFLGGSVARASTGLPPTTTSSPNVTAMSTDWPARYAPPDEVDSTDTTRGCTASTKMLGPANSLVAGRSKSASLPASSTIKAPALSASGPAWRRPSAGALSPGRTS